MRATIFRLLNKTSDMEQELSVLQRMGKPTSPGFIEARAQRFALGHTNSTNTSMVAKPELSALDLSKRIAHLESSGASLSRPSVLADQLDLGQSYAIAGNPDRAIKYFSELLKTDSENYLLHYYLSAADHAMGNVARAREARQISLACYRQSLVRKTADSAGTKGALSR